MPVFAELDSWFAQEGSKGCLFLRALSEYGHKDPGITRHVLDHKQRGLDYLRARAGDSSPDELDDVAESLMLIMEGAVARAPVTGGPAAARRARLLAGRVLAHSPHTETTGGTP